MKTNKILLMLCLGLFIGSNCLAMKKMQKILVQAKQVKQINQMNPQRASSQRNFSSTNPLNGLKEFWTRLQGIYTPEEREQRIDEIESANLSDESKAYLKNLLELKEKSRSKKRALILGAFLFGEIVEGSCQSIPVALGFLLSHLLLASNIEQELYQEKMRLETLEALEKKKLLKLIEEDTPEEDDDF